MIFIILLPLFILFLILLNMEQKRRQMPLGPRPWPLLGNFPQLLFGQKWEEMFAQWRREFGALYTFWYGPLPTVLVADYEAAQELFVQNGDACASRGVNHYFNDMCRGGTYGLVLTSGSLWTEQRKFALKVLRDFGMGSNLMQEKVLSEVGKVVECLQPHASNGTIVDPVRYTDLAVGSVIHNILFGHGFDESNRADFDRLKLLAVELTRIGAEPLVAAGIMNEAVAKLPVFRSRMARFTSKWMELRSFMDKEIAERVELQKQEQLAKTDFINAFLMEMEDQNQSGKQHHFSLLQLNSVAIDMWVAGQETTASTLSWIFALLVAHPEIQAKIHEELDEHIQEDREVRMSDRNQLIYLNAFILEASRYANVIVQNVLRLMTRDVTIKGCTLKKGTFVCPQISAMLRDPKYFPAPDEFRPERFIGSDGRLQNSEYVVSFSMGKRACPGENLAKMELFLFTANLLNKFRFTPSDKLPVLERQTGGISTAVREFDCRVEARF